MIMIVIKLWLCFNGYKDDDHTFKPLFIMLPKTSAYVNRCGGETKWMYFFIEDDTLFRKT